MLDIADTMAGVEKRLTNISKSGLDRETYNNIKDVIFGPLDAKRRKIKGVLGLLDQFDRAGAVKYLFDADEFIKRLEAQTIPNLQKRAVKTAGASIAPTLTAYQDIGEEGTTLDGRRGEALGRRLLGACQRPPAGHLSDPIPLDLGYTRPPPPRGKLARPPWTA